MNVMKISALLFVIILTSHGFALADSLLVESRGLCDLYSSRTATQVGDVVTIIFNEKTVSNQVGAAKLVNTYEVGTQQGIGYLEKFLGLGLSGGETVNVETNTTQKNSLYTTMSAIVVEVLPNNQLRIEGHKSLEVNHETQKLTISGIVRTTDIMSDNTIESNKIGELQAKVNGLPIERSVKKRRGGIIRWVWNLLF